MQDGFYYVNAHTISDLLIQLARTFWRMLEGVSIQLASDFVCTLCGKNNDIV